MKKLIPVAVAAAMLMAACTGSQPEDDASSSTSPAATSSTSQAASPSLGTSATTLPQQLTPSTATSTTPTKPKCQAHGVNNNWLPDKKCTPGIADRRVTQATIAKTICVSGWASKVRKEVPESYYATNKRRSIRDYGNYGGVGSENYEYDHLIPISLGGDPDDLRNLWAEWDATPNPKDAVEAKVLAAVRDGRMTLTEARQGFQKDWTKIKVPSKNAKKKTAGCGVAKSTSHRVAPVPVQRPKPAPRPAPSRHYVTPGAFCSPTGATGTSKKGVTYHCKGPGQPRWRR